MDLIIFIRILLNRKKLLIIIPLLAMVFGYFLLKNQADTYKAKAVLSSGIIDETKISLDNSENITSSFTILAKFSNLVELIKSQSIIELVSYRLILNDLSSGTPLKRPSSLLSDLNPQAKQNAIRILKEKIDSIKSLNSDVKDEHGIMQLIKSMNYDYESILRKLKVEHVGSSDFISIEFEAETASLAAFVPNTICEEFLRYNKYINGIKSSYSVDFFERLAREKKKELDGLVDQLKQYKVSNKIINLYEQTKAIVSQVSNLEIIRENDNKQIPALKTALVDINSRFTDKEKGYLERELIPNSKSISRLKDLLTQLNERQISLIIPSQSIKDSIEIVRALLKTDIEKASDDLILDPNIPKKELVLRKINSEIDLQIYQQNVKSIDKERARLAKIIENYAPNEATISSFEREISVIAEAYLVILNKLNMAKFSSENVEGNIQQTEPAIQPEKAEPNNKLILIIMMGLISFIFCIVIIFILEYIDVSIKSPKHFKKLTGLPLLGAIDLLKMQQLELKTIFDKDSDLPENEYFKEAIRKLRFELLDKSNKSKVILFASTRVNEGKTFILISLAYSLSMIGKKILLIDTNLKNNQLTNQFHARPQLFESLNLADDPMTFISKSSIDNIDILGSSQSNMSPKEIESGGGFSRLIENLKPHYDFIFMEISSLNKEASAREMLSVTEKFILVFAANSIIEDADKNSIAVSMNLGDKLLGCILNKVTLENLEQVQGEIKKKRSFIRIFTKKILTGNLAKAKTIETEIKP